jgi:multisubunit Na+/H+ antiporter MnhC subunit
MVTRNLIRIIIGIELLTKAVTILIAAAGYATANTALAQCFIITMIVIEVVVMVTAGGIVVRIFRNEDSIDSQILKRLKG